MAEIIRSFHYDEQGEPYMRLTTKRPRAMGNFPVAVRMQDVWKFAESHNPRWRAFMFKFCQHAITLLDLGEATTWRMGKMADVIAEGIDELVAMPPPPMRDVPLEGVEVDASLSVDGGQSVKLKSEYTVEQVVDID